MMLSMILPNIFISNSASSLRSSISSSPINLARMASFLFNSMVAEISVSAFSLLSCFICIFFSSLSIAADLFFHIPTNLFSSNFLHNWTRGLRPLFSTLDRIAACPTRDPTRQ